MKSKSVIEPQTVWKGRVNTFPKLDGTSRVARFSQKEKDDFIKLNIVMVEEKSLLQVLHRIFFLQKLAGSQTQVHLIVIRIFLQGFFQILLGLLDLVFMGRQIG